MKLHYRNLTTMALTTTAVLFGFAGNADAQITHAHIDRLALRLQRQAEELHHEVHAHFRGTRDYVHLDHDVAEMEQLARHIHEVAHNRGSINHLRADVEKLDRLFHHIEDLTRHLSRTRQISFRAMHHFNEVLHDIDDTLHHLRDDLAHLQVPQPNHYGFGRYTVPVPPSYNFRFRW